MANITEHYEALHMQKGSEQYVGAHKNMNCKSLAVMAGALNRTLPAIEFSKRKNSVRNPFTRQIDDYLHIIFVFPILTSTTSFKCQSKSAPIGI